MEFVDLKIRQMIFDAVKKFDSSVKLENIHLEHPENEEHGDYSSNIAMAMFSKIKNEKLKSKNDNVKFKIKRFKSPLELAEAIVKTINNKLSTINHLNRVKAVPPGFINFWLSKEWLGKQVERVLKEKDGFGRLDILKAKKIMVEFTDPNPFKEFHIGHLYSNSVGESLSRLFEALGAIVKRANYQGDVGMHVGKSIWGLIRKIKNEKLKSKNDNAKLKIDRSKLRKLEEKSLTERVNFLGQAYALGASAFEKDKKAQEEIKDLNYYVYLVGQENLEKEKDWQPQVDYKQYIEGKEFDLSEIRELYNKGRKWSLDYFEMLYKRLGTKFDYYFFESLAGEYGFKIVQDYLKKGVFEKSEGAVVYKGEKHGLHTRVFINSLGLPTYEAKDLGLALVKYKEFPYDQSFNITGNETDAYFKVVLAALKEVNRPLWEKTAHLSHGMVRLPEGKMSSRTGKVLTGEWLLDEVKRRIKKAFPEVDEQRAEVIAVGAVKYALLKSSIGRDVVFDFEKSLSLEGDSGPYLQYTYARAQSVLRKSQIPKSKFQANSKIQISNYKLNSEENILLRTIYKFPEVVKEAGENYAPNLICNFLFDLAQKFNGFYNKHRILELAKQSTNQLINQSTNYPINTNKNQITDKPNNQTIKQQKNEIRDFRLALTAATAQILQNGLNLLGIKTLERM